MISGTTEASPMKLCTVIVPLSTIQARLFTVLKVQWVFRDPLVISGTIKASLMKLCTVIVLLIPIQARLFTV